MKLTNFSSYELEMRISGSLGGVFFVGEHGSPVREKILFAHEALRAEATELLGIAILIPLCDDRQKARIGYR